VERSDVGQQKLERLAMLNRQARRSGLDGSEREEQRELQRIFASETEVTRS